MEKSKKTVIQAVICIGLLCVIWGGYFLVKHYGTDRIMEIKEYDFSWEYQVDSVKTEDKDFVLQGFAFELEKNSKEGAFEIVLQDIESGEKYFPKMEYMEREDVNSYFLCEYDYLQSGFVATIKAKKLNLDEKNYEVLLRVEGERLAYQTGTYISKGKLMYENPLEFEPLDVKGTDLENVVENGVLRVYRPDYGVYVYQYEGELYWIAEEDYDWDEGGDCHIQFHLETTQDDKLPQERIENKSFWDNLSFSFVQNEIVEWKTKKYRVTRKQIPTEYAIEKISTGKYQNGEWIWREEFCPYYYFDKR